MRARYRTELKKTVYLVVQINTSYPKVTQKAPKPEKGRAVANFPSARLSPHLLAPEPPGSEQPSPTPPNTDVLAGEGSFLHLPPHLRASRSTADLNCSCPTQPCRVSFAASPFLSIPLESLSRCQRHDVGPCKLSGRASAAQLPLSTPEDQQGDLGGERTPKVD